jgi:hypothetical protein
LRRYDALPGVISGHVDARYRHGVLSRAGAVRGYDPGVRALVIALCLVGCKKHKPEEAAPPPAEPSRGHSVTHFKDGGTLRDPDQMPVETAGAGDAGEATVDASLSGDNGSPASRDAQGHVHGPGGPLFMGRGDIACDATHDHCIRKGTWFSADNYDNKHLFRALPVFEFEGKWYNWRGSEAEVGKLFRTELATPEKVRPGSPIVVWLPETDSPPWAGNEYDALTSSRWDIAVVLSVNSSAKTFKIPSWPDDLPIANGRVIVEQKSSR